MIFALSFYALTTIGLFVLLAKNWVSLSSYRAGLAAHRQPASPIVYNNDIAHEDGSEIAGGTKARVGLIVLGVVIVLVMLMAISDLRSQRSWDPGNTGATPGQIQSPRS